MKPSTDTRVAFVYSGYVGNDWVGIYVDGKRIHEGHQLDSQEILNALKIKFDNFVLPGIQFSHRGQLPDNLNELEVDTNLIFKQGHSDGFKGLDGNPMDYEDGEQREAYVRGYAEGYISRYVNVDSSV